MYDEIKDGKYDNPMTYPQRSDFERCECGVKHQGQPHSYCSNCGKQVNLEWEENLSTAYGMYRREGTLIIEKFKKDAMDDIGIPETYPKYNEVWNKAWSDGHANGLYSVYQQLEDLVDLLVL